MLKNATNLVVLLLLCHAWTWGQNAAISTRPMLPKAHIQHVLSQAKSGLDPAPAGEPTDASAAWISTWYFSQSPGTYTAITGGTVMGTESNDENIFGPYTIGFNFSYNGTVYTQFSVATNGYIGLGSGALASVSLPISAATGSNNVMSALGLDLQGQTGSTLQYLMTGTAPNRTLVVQWSNYRKKSATGDAFNFQIRLNEVNNSIVFSYGAFTVNANNSTPQVGLRGASNTEFNNRLGNATYSTWDYSGVGTANTSTCRLRAAIFPDPGQVYGWTPLETVTASLPVIENFDGVPIGTLPKGWVIENTNGDAFPWMSTATLPNSDPNSMTIIYNFASTTTAMNDWFFSPKVSLVAGKTYRVQCFYQNDGGTTYPEKLEVKYGATATGAGMTSAAIISNTNVTGSYQLGSGTFSPTTSGDYYIGFHGFSAADMDYLFVDDIVIEEVFAHDAAAVAMMNPTKLPSSQLLPWFGRVKNNGSNTETFPAATKMRENTVLSSTQTNTITSLTAGSTQDLSGNFNFTSLGAASTFDLSLETQLTGDLNASNNLYTNYTRACVKDTAYAWDDGTAESAVGFNTGSGWLGQLYYLSAPDTLTSITIRWGTIPGALTGNSLEIYNVAGGVPTTKVADIVTGISLAATDANTLKTYKPTSPIILPAGTYWIGAHQSVALSGTYLVSYDGTGLNAANFFSGFAFFSTTGTAWTDYTTSGLYVFNAIRPNFANVYVPFVANPGAFTANAVSTTEIDLSWTLNAGGNNVLVAWNTSNTFGNPTGSSYTPGSTIAGGGTVLQFNNATAFSHTGLSSNTVYYYKAWSYNGSIYSGGVTASDQTWCPETPAPWTEDFEGTTFPSTCWAINTGAQQWARSTDASGFGTGTASAKADFFNYSSTTPFAIFSMPFNPGTLAAPTLAFDYAYATYTTQVDEMDVYYSTNGGTTFTLLLAMPGGPTGILNTGGAVTTAFIPTAAQWATQTLILPTGTNMVAFNAISAYGNNLYLDNVRIQEGLLHDVGVSGLDPKDVYPTGTILPKAYIKNYGGSTETFSVTMTIGTYSSTKTVSAITPGTTQEVIFDAWTPANGTYTMTVTTLLSGDLNPANNTATKTVKVMTLNKTVYGYATFSATSNGPVSFNLNNPGTLAQIVNEYPVVTYPASGTWANDVWYATIYAAAAPYNLVTFDPTTGARTVIGDMGVNINALSYDKVGGILYGAGYDGTNSILYSINMTTGLATQIGTIGTQLIINMAINSSGVCYATDLTSDVLGTINLSTAAFTAVGSIGFNANYAQDMEFDRETGELYMAAYGATGQLRWVDVTTGNTMLIGEFQDGLEITGFAIPYTTVPATTTVTGTVTSEESNCYNATGTITVGGASAFTIQPGGTATFIAGINILFEPGTSVPAGATMHGYIGTTYCGQTDAPMVAAAVQENPVKGIDQGWFSLYPNPTSGNITIVQQGDVPAGDLQVEIYSMQGERILASRMIGARQQEFNTASLPDGVYFVKLNNGASTQTIKLVKTR